MKLIIQIPCLNESQTLPITLADLPRVVPGFSSVEWLVIDDGSTDDTYSVSKAHGVDHVIRHSRNLGLAKSFTTGITAAINLGADVIVNTDADNQYCADDIVALTDPIVRGRAEIVVGARPISSIAHFSGSKKWLQKFGSKVVQIASNTDIEDAPSGFRAMSRNAAKRLFVFGNYTYTLETIIQAGQQGIAIVSVPIRVNSDLRPSRLMRSMSSYIRKSIITILRIYLIYRPLHFFGTIALTLFAFASVISLRFLWFYVTGSGDGHVQSLILAAILYIIGFQAVLLALLADLLSANRKILEDIRYKIND
jgi:glycosyltransferase involved in cell wall biosynthesis